MFAISVVGCTDVDVQNNHIVERSLYHMILFCESSRDTYTINCVNNEWDTHVVACKGEIITNVNRLKIN